MNDDRKDVSPDPDEIGSDGANHGASAGLNLTREWAFDERPERREATTGDRRDAEGSTSQPMASSRNSDVPVVTVTTPKKRIEHMERGAPVMVPSLELVGTTLPPEGERYEAERAEVPSVEREAARVPSGWLECIGRHRPLAGLVTVLGAALSYAIASGFVRARDAGSQDSGAPPPAFLQAPHSAELGAGPSPSASPEDMEANGATDALRELGEPSETEGDNAGAGLADAGVGSDSRERRPRLDRDGDDTTSPLVAPKSLPRSEDDARKRSPGSRPSAARRAGDSPRVASRASSIKRPQAPVLIAPAGPTGAGSGRSGARFDAVSASKPAAAVRPLTTYAYGDNALFAVVTAPLRVTDITLERGEKLVSRPAAGDPARWVVSVLDSFVQGEPQQHVFIKPLRHGLRTNLTLTTQRRSYFLELASQDGGPYMAGVQWMYPADASARRRQELSRLERERQSMTRIADLSRLRFDYRIEVRAGAPRWKPTMVFGDGTRTFIRFPSAVAGASAPLLFVLRNTSAKDAKYINYRIKGDLYVIDCAFDTAELRLASRASAASVARQEVVRITRQ